MKFEPRNAQFKETILHHLKRQEFMKHIDCSLTKIEPGYIVAEIPLELQHQQQIGYVHGGVTFTIADVAAGFAAFTLVPEGVHPVTAEIKITCLKPGIGTRLRAEGRVVKPGKNLFFCEADVWCIDEPKDSKQLIARATTTMAVVYPKK